MTIALSDLSTRLQQEVLLADGGLGSLLFDRGANTHIPFEWLNLTDKEMVQKAHLDYLLAGSNIIETNTFGANRLKLGAAESESKVWDINVWGAKIARSAREISGEPALVAGSVGPLTAQVGGSLTPAQMRALFREQMEGLLAGGVDLFIIETMSDPVQAIEAVRAAREISRLPVVVQFSFWPDSPDRIHGRERLTGTADHFYTAAGYTPQKIADALNNLPEVDRPDVLGVNCSFGPVHLLKVVQQMQAAVNFPMQWSAMPNAGLPTYVDGRLLYTATPGYFASMLASFVKLGIRLIGGCCGTTPGHIAAMKRALTELAHNGALNAAPAQIGSPVAEVTAEDAPVLANSAFYGEMPVESGRADKTEMLRSKLGRQFVISVELDPPKGPVVTKMLQAAKALQSAGADVINIADSPMARVRMGAIASSCLIQNQVGMETIVHLTSRDRNLMGLQSDLLGAHAMGLRNVLALTGDPPSLGNARATPVYDVDAIGLVKVITELNRGLDLQGNPIGKATDFTIACAFNPNAQDLGREIARLRAKLAAGAHLVMTQPVYHLEPLHRSLEALGGCDVPILLGIMPLHSYRHAEYLHNEVPGISVPASIRHELQLAGDDGLRVGLEQAARLVAEAYKLVAGIYVVLSFGKHEPICHFIEQIREQVRRKGES